MNPWLPTKVRFPTKLGAATFPLEVEQNDRLALAYNAAQKRIRWDDVIPPTHFNSNAYAIIPTNRWVRGAV